MKRNLLFVFVLLSAFAFTSFSSHSSKDKELTWHTNYAEAVKLAKKENKTLLLNFTGSDWCGWCIKLDREVFSQEEFVKYAEKNLVCVKLDFPRSKQLSETEATQNKSLAQKYQIQGFPTILLLNNSETTIAQTGYQKGGPEKYIKHLEGLIGN